MVYVFMILSPGCDLHGETFTVTATTRVGADARAASYLRDTFSLASAERRATTSMRFVCEYTSRRAFERSEESL